MTLSRLAALVLLVVGFAALLFSLFFAASPWLMPPSGKWDPLMPANREAQELAENLGPTALSVLLLVVSTPTWLLPWMAAVGVWWFRVLPEQSAIRAARNRERDLEARLQSLFDHLGHRLLTSTADAPEDSDRVRHEILSQALGRMQELDEARKNRLLRFLEILEMPGVSLQLDEVAASFSSSQSWPKTLRDGWVRPTILMLLLLAIFAFTWGLLSTATSYLVQPFLELFGIPTSLRESLVGLLGCWVVALVAASAALGLTLLARIVRKERDRRAEDDDADQAAALERYCTRLSTLRQDPSLGGTTPSAWARRLLRAHTLLVLPQLNGGRRGELVCRLYAAGLLQGVEALDLRGAQLQGAVLSRASLVGARLTQVDLSGADLQAADLRLADLSGSHLAGADLRRAELSEADLYRSTLWYARMHQCHLRGARLREAALDFANLWQADLTGADLTGARVSPEQLGAVRHLPGPEPQAPATGHELREAR